LKVLQSEGAGTALSALANTLHDGRIAAHMGMFEVKGQV